MRCTSHSATSTSRVASSLVAVAALKPMLRCSQSPNCVIARSRYEGLPFSSNHDHLRPPPRPVFRHHGGGRRHHRGRHLPDPGGGGGARRLRGARARRLAAGRRGRPDRSEEHTSELQSQSNLVCRLLLEKKKNKKMLLRDGERLGLERQDVSRG